MNRKMNHEKNFEMREIKFRGKRVDKEEFAFGDLLTGMGYKKGGSSYYLTYHIIHRIVIPLMDMKSNPKPSVSTQDSRTRTARRFMKEIYSSIHIGIEHH